LAATTAWHVRNSLRVIGLHLRLTSTLTALIEKAIRLELPLFQSFLVVQESGKLLVPDAQDVQTFIALRQKYFKDVFMHGSYWINVANIRMNRHYNLQRELKLAHQLEYSHIILHPGSAKGAQLKSEGIDAVARVLNKIFSKTPHIRIVLENGAHGNLTVGSDLEDFKTILEKLKFPDSISFCIDTAHAHSYGYDLSSMSAQEVFIDILEETIGIERIALLHLNDTKQIRGSKVDKHEIIGDGVIGDEALKQFVLNPRIAHIPLIMELPELSEEEEYKVLDKVRAWHK